MADDTIHCPHSTDMTIHHADSINEIILPLSSSGLAGDFNEKAESNQSCQVCETMALTKQQNSAHTQTKNPDLPESENYHPRISRRFRYNYTRLL